MEHADEVIRMSITEVAERTAAAEGSIVSLSRRLGVSGFIGTEDHACARSC